MAEPADPVRERVEATLHRLVELVTTRTVRLLRAAGRTVGESVGLARTMFNLTVDGLLGWEVDAGVPRFEHRRRRGSGAAAPLGREVLARRSPCRSPLAIALVPSTWRSRATRTSPPATSSPGSIGSVPSELAAIRAFEVANRGRRTVVGKIDQLLARS